MFDVLELPDGKYISFKVHSVPWWVCTPISGDCKYYVVITKIPLQSHFQKEGQTVTPC